MPPPPPDLPPNPTMLPRPPALSISPIHVAIDEAPRTAPPPTDHNARLRTQPEFLMTGVVAIPARPGSECTTYLEPLADDVLEMARCGHVFHCTCILAWFQSSHGQRSRCPNCRAELYAQAARVGDQRGVLAQSQLEVQHGIDEARRLRDEMIQHEVDEEARQSQRIDALIREVRPQLEASLHQSIQSGGLPHWMLENEETSRRREELRLAQQNGTVLPSIFAPMPIIATEANLQRTDIPESLRRSYEVELDRRWVEAVGRNIGAPTTVGTEGSGGGSLRSHLTPPVHREAVATHPTHPRHLPPRHSVANSNIGEGLWPHQRSPLRPYNADWLNERLEAQRAETSGSRGHRGQASQLPHPRVEPASRRGSFGISTTTPASGSLPRPGLVQGIARPGTPIPLSEDSPEFTRASSPLLMTDLAVAEPFTFQPAPETGLGIQLPRQEDPQRPNVRFEPDTESSTKSHWWGNFASPRTSATPRSPRSTHSAESAAALSRWPLPSPAPDVNFGSTDLRESIINSQRYTTFLEIPRPDQEMRDFLRQTDPSPVVDDSGGFARRAATRHERRGSFSQISSMEANHPRDFPQRTAEPLTVDSDVATSHELRQSFFRAARNRRMPFPAGPPPFGRQHQQSPAQDVDMRDTVAVAGSEVDGTVTDQYLRSRRLYWGLGVPGSF